MDKKERLEWLNENYKFPCRIIFHLGFVNGEYKILLQEYPNKEKLIRNIRLKEIKQSIEEGVMTPLNVQDVDSAEILEEVAEYYKNLWVKEETK